MTIRKASAGISLGLTLCGIAYACAELYALRRFRERPKRRDSSESPPFTIFKPLHGDEPQLYENLRSFCIQDYPEYQIIFGSRDATDPALETARRLQLEFPDREITIVAGWSGHGAMNPKIANLMAMMPSARHDLFAMVDSDIRVAPDYLSSLAAAFRESNTGAVTCLYSGVPENAGGLAARAGAMMCNDHFMASVLVAQMIEPLEYCFGATMAVRRSVLEKIGGLAALGDHLADDFRLGQLVSAAGREVALAGSVVEMTVSDPDLRQLWRHELRWQRTVKSARPRGFAGQLITYALPLACLHAALSRAPSRFIVLAVAIALRVCVRSEARRTFAPGQPLEPWLIPLVDALVAGTWFAAFLGTRVSWRTREYAIGPDGKLS